jgi:hypothetical protein
MTTMTVILAVLCVLLLTAFIYERYKSKQISSELDKESVELDNTNRISDIILSNIHAFILFIDSDFFVLKTNYYTLTETLGVMSRKKVGDLLKCRNALSASGGCGTSGLCPRCPVRLAIQKAFDTQSSFTDLEASLEVMDGNQSYPLQAEISGKYISMNNKDYMVLTVHDVTRLKNIEKELRESKGK